MKTPLRSLFVLRESKRITGKLGLLLFALSVCLCISTYANTKVLNGGKYNKIEKPIIKVKDNRKNVDLKTNHPAFLTAPTISYKTPDTYKAGVTITPLAPISSGVAAAGYSKTPVTFSAGFNSNFILAGDAAGNVYIGDNDNGSIKKIPAGGGSPQIILSGFGFISGLAIGSGGQICVADASNNTVKKFAFTGLKPFLTDTVFETPIGLAVDSAGNMFTGQFDNQTVVKINADGSGQTNLFLTQGSPWCVATDAAGNVYAGDAFQNTIEKFNGNGGDNTLITTLFEPASIAFDVSGNIFVTNANGLNDTSSGQLEEIPANGGPQFVLIGGTHPFTFVTVDGSGKLVVSDYTSSSLKKITPVGGYYINNILPTGLVFSNATGIISGTPTEATPAKTFTITAYNTAGSGAANVKINIGDVPNISYNGHQSYYINTAVKPLAPKSIRVDPLGFSTIPNTAGSGFKHPKGVAADAADNIYVADEGNNAIKKIPAGGGTPVNFGSGFNAPAGIAVDVTGNVYVADAGNNSIKKIPAAGGVPVILGSGFNAPTGVAVDTAGNVYVADKGNNIIKKIPAGGGSPVSLGSGFNAPTGVAIDAAGNIYVADAGNNAVKKIATGSITPVIFASGLNAPTGVTTDNTGNVYVSDTNNNTVKKFAASGGTPVTLGSGFNTPGGLATDNVGNIYVADAGNNAIKEINPIGGYFISNALPAGLNFNRSTGVISGTPTTASQFKDYTVTAYDGFGFFQTKLSISVIDLSKPIILSYTNPPTIIAGKNIAALVPTSSGVAAPDYGSLLALSSGLVKPVALTVDLAGNVYVTDNNKVKKIPAAGGSPTTVSSVAINPNGIAVDAAGNVYVIEANNHAIDKIPVGGGSPVVFGSGFVNVSSLTVDGSGNLFVVDQGNGTIFKIPAGGGKPVKVFSGDSALFNTSHIAVGGDGMLYISVFDVKEIIKVIQQTGYSVTTFLAFHPNNIAVDASGVLYVTDGDNKTVKKLQPNGKAIMSIGSFNSPQGAIVDGSGNVYVADRGTKKVFKISPTGGYFVSPSLPVGLSLDYFTGIISGNPTVVSAAKNYTITGYNIGGGKSALLNLKINLPPVPTINYQSPITLTAGKPITPVSPTSTGVALPGFSGQVKIASGFMNPLGIAADAAGNVYVADYGANTIKKIPAGGGNPVIIGSGFNFAQGVAVDADGNIYVADTFNNMVKKIPAAGGAIVTISSGLNTPRAIALDAMNNVYITQDDKTIKKIPAAGGTPITLATLNDFPEQLAVDATGNVYVGILSDKINSILEIPASGGPPVSLNLGVSFPGGMAVDAAGNLYVCSSGTGTVLRLSKGVITPIFIGQGFDLPSSIAINGAGNVFIADEANGLVTKITPVGGYYIGPFLPRGLNFDTETGVISGMPTEARAAKDYIVTAYNFGVHKSATVNITVLSSNANLARLKISSGTLTPAFISTTTVYTASVSSAITSIKLTPTASNPTAVIKINGVAVASGSASADLPLVAGENIFNTIVTAQSGASKTYKLTVTRAAASPVIATVGNNAFSFQDQSFSTTNSKKQLIIFPNPAKKTSTVYFKLNNFEKNTNVNIEVTTLQGKRIQANNYITNDQGSINVLLDQGRNIENGIYIINLKSSSGQLFGKLIINDN